MSMGVAEGDETLVCYYCNQPIEGQYRETIGGEKVHPDCLGGLSR